jgi:hypothetical protein
MYNALYVILITIMPCQMLPVSQPQDIILTLILLQLFALKSDVNNVRMKLYVLFAATL